MPKSQWAQCETKLYESLELLDHVYRNNPDETEWWKYVARLCCQSYWAFLRVGLGYRWMDPFWHGEVIAKFIDLNNDNDKLIILPRGSGKTATITTPYPVWKLCQNPFLLCQITNAAEDKAQAFTSTVAQLLVKTPRLKRMFPLVKPTTGQWSRKGYKLDTQFLMDSIQDGSMAMEGAVARTDPTLSSYGMRGNITGAHVGLQLHDDLITHEVARSPQLLLRCEDFLKEAFRCCDAHGEIIVCGTRWLFSDYYGKLLDGELSAHKGPFKVLKHGVYKENGDLVWPQRTFFDASGNLQKAGYTEEQLDAAKKDQFFAALYLCEPRAEGEQILEVSMVDIFETVPFPIGHIDCVVFEKEGAGEMISQAFSQQCRLEGRQEIRISTVSAGRTEKKEARITTILGNEINGGKLHVHRNVWKGNGNLGDEMRVFPQKGSGIHDDLLDCATYLVKLCKEPRPGELPRPIIIVDPAWTAKSTSDPTAIMIGVKLNGETWILDSKRIKTIRPEILSQEIFRIYYQWNNTEKKAVVSPKTRYNGVRGFYSLTRGKPRSSRGIEHGNFTVDLGLLQREKKQWQK